MSTSTTLYPLPKPFKLPKMRRVSTPAHIDTLSPVPAFCAGIYGGHNQYVGRVTSPDGSDMIGPVTKEAGLLIRDENTYKEVQRDFEVLTVDPSDPSQKADWVRFRSDGGFLETATPISVGRKSDGRKVFVGRVAGVVGVVELTEPFPPSTIVVQLGPGNKRTFSNVEIEMLCNING